jgi:hypothetical protein
VGLLIVAGFYAALSAFVLVINLLLQLGLRWTPLHTGLTLIPWALGTAVVGLLALWWSVAHWGASITFWKLAPALLVAGFGAGSGTPRPVPTSSLRNWSSAPPLACTS